MGTCRSVVVGVRVSGMRSGTPKSLESIDEGKFPYLNTNFPFFIFQAPAISLCLYGTGMLGIFKANVRGRGIENIFFNFLPAATCGGR